MRFTYHRSEKLKSRKLIGQLFEQGQRLKAYPLQVVYLTVEHEGNRILQAGFSVSKRKFKRAVDRNKVKRLMRESYRLNKHKLVEHCTQKHILMFIYISSELETYKTIDKSLNKLLEQLDDKLNNKNYE